ncbi:MAG: tRNA (N6-isopentenyl adenosine(37)-C2)-methylthiotransferase MiaB [SAR202 cluster bacterium]|nr:tRNA (N6-isopentenyl adenosine(37)-C2)-methylthiotransferase MiaB [SAR202 cluster bacterium]
MKSYYIWTIGCQMNKADSERLESAMGQMGLAASGSPSEADVVVLNSCVVRQNAEDKVVGMLTSLKPLKTGNPDKVLALMGCMVGPKNDALHARYPFVDVFMRPQQFDPLIDLLGERMGVDPGGCVGPLVVKPAVATYVPIIHGCDKFCTFCIIPYRRGREVSRPVDELVREVEMLVERGVKEVTLLGQNVDSYGHDLPGAPDLADLLTAVNGVAGIQRIRFLTSHPNDMSDRIIDAVASLDKVCEHVNLPFQAGDDEVLARMRRGYTNAQYREKIDRIRARIPNVSLSTDVIVGFCGETDVQFRQTHDLIRDIRFDKVHLASYSTRPGTIAVRQFEDDVPSEVKEARKQALEELQEGISAEINAGLLGRTMEVLVEDVRNGKGYGRNRNEKIVHIDGAESRVGETVRVQVHKTSPWALQGTLAETPVLVGGRN